METTQQVAKVGLPIVLALFSLLVIEVCKSDAVPINIPAKWRPLSATVLGLATTFASQVAMGALLAQALVTSLLTGLGSVGAYELVTKLTGSAKKPPGAPQTPQDGSKGPDAGKPPSDGLGGPARWLLAATFALVAVGCGGIPLEKWEKVMGIVRDSSTLLTISEPCIMKKRQLELEDCLAKPTDDGRRACTVDVQARWKGTVELLGTVRDGRCSLEPEKCPEEDASSSSSTGGAP